MSIAFGVDMGRRGVLLLSDSATFSDGMRCEDTFKIIITEHAAVGITGYKRNYQILENMLRQTKYSALLRMENGPYLFGEALSDVLKTMGEGGAAYPPDFACEAFIAQRCAPIGHRLWAANTDLMFDRVRTGPGCTPHPVAAIGSGRPFAMGGWVAATARSRHEARGAARRAVAAACTMSSMCDLPIVEHLVWPA